MGSTNWNGDRLAVVRRGELLDGRPPVATRRLRNSGFLMPGIAPPAASVECAGQGKGSRFADEAVTLGGEAAHGCVECDDRVDCAFSASPEQRRRASRGRPGLLGEALSTQSN